VDEAGAIYVAVGGFYYEVRKYAPNGSRVWWNQGLLPGYNVDFDPDTDGLDVYSSRHHFKLNLGDGSAPGDELRDPESPAYEPGSEWSLEGVTWDPFPDPLTGTVPYEERDEHGATARSSGNPLVRRIDGEPYLFVLSQDTYTPGADGKTYSNVIKIYRFLGERAVPTGSVRLTAYCAWGNGEAELAARAACEDDPTCICNPVPGDEYSVDAVTVLLIWNDSNSNGLEDETPQKTLSPSFFPEIGNGWTEHMVLDPPPVAAGFAFDVDSEGDLWLSFGTDIYDGQTVRRAGIWRLARTTNGYVLPTVAERKEYALKDFGILGGWSEIRFHRSPSQSMYVFAPAPGNHPENPTVPLPKAVYRIDNFLSSQRSLAL
ncbi:MAG TPA: hypothetical protein VFP10_07730, partial [Candidatus Eisenbacteria bacterium]|nr:hypothetical protein [Candidatus Eisenbacteria bacterium]